MKTINVYTFPAREEFLLEFTEGSEIVGVNMLAGHPVLLVMEPVDEEVTLPKYQHHFKIYMTRVQFDNTNLKYIGSFAPSQKHFFNLFEVVSK